MSLTEGDAKCRRRGLGGGHEAFQNLTVRTFEDAGPTLVTVGIDGGPPS